MKIQSVFLLMGFTLASFSNVSVASTDNPQYILNAPEACVITRDTGKKFCLKAGEIQNVLPNGISGHEVDLMVPSGLSLVLSDYPHLSYNRLASFNRYTTNLNLEKVKAVNGRYIDFSRPKSMRVVAVKKVPEACIISRQNGEKFCYPAGGMTTHYKSSGESTGYGLPPYIAGHQVDIMVPRGLRLSLNDTKGMTWNRGGHFDGYKTNEQLRHVKTSWQNDIDLSRPRSMSVEAITWNRGYEACIIARDSGDKFCLTAGKSTMLPPYIRGHEVDVMAPSGYKVRLSNRNSSLNSSYAAAFSGYPDNKQLEYVKAFNGLYLDFSAPQWMEARSTKSVPQACIISRITGNKFCLEAGQETNYALPPYIRNHKVDIDTNVGSRLSVTLSDFDNLSYNRLATFYKSATNEQLVRVKAMNGQYLDFSRPHSMRVQLTWRPPYSYTQSNVNPSTPPVTADKTLVDAISGSVTGNDATYTVKFDAATTSDRTLGLKFANKFNSVIKIDFSSLVYASFDGGRTWPKVVDIDSSGSLVVPKGAKIVTLRALTLVDGKGDSNKTIELSVWLDSNQKDKVTKVIDISHSYSSNSVKIKSMITEHHRIIEGQSNTSRVTFDGATKRNTGLRIQLITNTAQIWNDLEADVELVYKDFSRTYQYDVSLIGFKVLNIPKGVTAVNITYHSFDDDIPEPDEVFYFSSWLNSKSYDGRLAETVIVDND